MTGYERNVAGGQDVVLEVEGVRIDDRQGSQGARVVVIVVAFLSHEGVAAAAAVERVIARAADEGVIAAVAAQVIVVGGAPQVLDLGQRVAVAKAVRGRSSDGNVHAGRIVGVGGGVTAVAAPEVIVSGAPFERIVAFQADQYVVPGAAEQVVVPGVADEGVVMRRSYQVLEARQCVVARPVGRLGRADDVQVDVNLAGGVGVRRRVDAGSALERVVARAAFQDIVAGVTRQVVTVRGAPEVLNVYESIGPGAPGGLRPRNAQVHGHSGRRGLVGRCVAAVAAVEDVVSSGAFQDVVARSAQEAVASSVAPQNVAEVRSLQVLDRAQHVRIPVAVLGEAAQSRVHACGSRGVRDQIRARSTVQLVKARAAVERIVPALPHEDVGSGTAPQIIAPVAAGDGVVAFAALQDVIPVATVQVVVSVAPEQDVVRRISPEPIGVGGSLQVVYLSQRVPAGACGVLAKEDGQVHFDSDFRSRVRRRVRSAAAGERIVARAAGQDVIAAVTGQIVVILGPDQVFDVGQRVGVRAPGWLLPGDAQIDLNSAGGRRV